MDEYRLPEIPLKMHAFVKASSAVGIYFICPVCHMEILYPDERWASHSYKSCPGCHTALIVPEGVGRTMVIQKAQEAFYP